MARSPLPDRFYRALLKLFPREFRGDFGDQMTDDFRDQREDAKSRQAVLRLWAVTALDAVNRAPREHLDLLRRDAGYAVRLFRRRPGMTASALLTLAIGIGLNAAVFSVAHGVLWRSLPLPDSDRLVSVSEVGPPPAREPSRVSPANFRDWEAGTRTLDGLAAISSASLRIIQQAGAEQVPGAEVSRRFFTIVPAALALGRHFSGEDYARVEAQLGARDPKHPRRAPQPGVAVIGYGLWHRQFGGRPDVIGQKVPLGDLGDVEIVGVLREGFAFPLFPDVEVWLPAVPEPGSRRARYLTVIGRVAPGTNIDEAQSEFDLIAKRLEAQYPEANTGRGARVISLREHVTTGVVKQLWLLAGGALCVLLIVCANVSNLLLTLGSGRRRELAARVALGASRAHIVRQALTEGLVLACGGGIAGFLLANWTLPLLVSAAPASIPRLDEVSVGLSVAAFAIIASVCVGLVSSVVAIVGSRRITTQASLRASAVGATSAARRLRQAIIIGEIAVALMLAVAASLLVQTMRIVNALPLGFDPASVISIGLAIDAGKLQAGGGRAKLESDIVAAVRSLPGVVAAGVGARPLGGGGMRMPIRLPEEAASATVKVESVGPGYLEALGARLVSGRFVDDRDDGSGPKVALVNEAAARAYLHGGALGRTILSDGTPMLVIGVLGDIRTTTLEDAPPPTVYLPSAQTPVFSSNNVLVRTSGDPRELLPAIRTAVQRIDPELPLTRVHTLEDRLSEATAPRRFTLRLVGIFAMVALGLAVIGIYGVVSESVAQRVPEIGVRMALGATGAAVMRLILCEGGWMITAGVLLGVIAALALNDIMIAFVFGVPTTDPTSYAVAAISLTLATLAACLVPARRASRVDPLVALRCE